MGRLCASQTKHKEEDFISLININIIVAFRDRLVKCIGKIMDVCAIYNYTVAKRNKKGYVLVLFMV